MNHVKNIKDGCDIYLSPQERSLKNIYFVQKYVTTFPCYLRGGRQHIGHTNKLCILQNYRS